MPDFDFSNVRGNLDNVAPQYLPEERWHQWNLFEIFDGSIGLNKYIPKINDTLFNHISNETYKVINIDPETGIADYVPLNGISTGVIYQEPGDTILFNGGGTPSNTFIAYLNTHVTPHVMTVDERVYINGSNSRFARVFKGKDISNLSNVISVVRDVSNNVVGNEIDLELVSSSTITNHSVKVPKSFTVNTSLVNGDIVTLVTYNDLGSEVSIQELKVIITGFNRSINTTAVYINSIDLITQFIPNGNGTEIRYPRNVPFTLSNFKGRVTYSNGDTKEYPIDGNKFRLIGIDNLSQFSTNIQLQYTLTSTELTNIATGITGRIISKNYTFTYIAANKMYNVKLYCYPVWVSVGAGYTLKWFLNNLDRNIHYDVTNKVTLTGGTYDPLLFGSAQNLTAHINLHDISLSYPNHTYSQGVTITLNGEPSPNETPWLVRNGTTLDDRVYGNHLYFSRIAYDLRQLVIGSDINDFTEWLNAFYYDSSPLIDPISNAIIPRPTHMELAFNNTKVIVPITAWNSNIDMGVNLTLNSTVIIRFIKQVNGSNLTLSYAAAVIIMDL